MKFIEHDGSFQVAPDDVVSYQYLPAGYYKINYDSTHDIFSLDRTYEFSINDNKIYGVQKDKLNKVLKAYDASNRSLGVLLSGDKGIGKSLFAKLLCMSMYAKGKAIIIIDKTYKGLDRFLTDIPGDVVFLFDEFDKTFKICDSSEGRDESSQESLLSLFDGIGTQKRLFIVTANETENLSDCMLNRTGRFHYHFIFNYPNSDEITEYFKDNMINYDQSEVDKVVLLSNYIKLNYDSLRSIAFEFNLGYKLNEFIDDLNIKTSQYPRYIYKFKNIDGKDVNLYTPGDNDYAVDIYNAGMLFLSVKKENWRYDLKIKLSSNIKFGSRVIKANTYSVIADGDFPVQIDTTKDVPLFILSSDDTSRTSRFF